MESGEGEPAAVTARVATEEDLAGVTRTLAGAFREDPLWTWAFPNGEGLAAWWRFLVESALRYPWVWIAGDHAAVTVWIPPGGRELTEKEQGRVGALFDELLGRRAPQVMELLERFEAAHPTDEPHYYLSLFGTHPEHRGHGRGMALLAQNLARIDEERMPAYLESSNPANEARYERVGFRRVGEFSTPDGSRTVATMWREPR